MLGHALSGSYIGGRAENFSPPLKVSNGQGVVAVGQQVVERHGQRLKTAQNAPLRRAEKSSKINTSLLVNGGEGTFPAVRVRIKKATAKGSGKQPPGFFLGLVWLCCMNTRKPNLLKDL